MFQLRNKEIFTSENEIRLEVCRTRSSRYSRTSVARTLMAHLPWLFQTRSRVPWNKKPIVADLR